ncbi:MAG: hypothetical protein ACPGYT_05345 [Nitrospirales bacterium]
MAMTIISLMVLFIPLGCSHEPKKYQVEERSMAPPNHPEPKSLPKSTQSINNQEGMMSQKEREEERPEEENSLDSKIKAVDDFFNVLGDILN